jgi:branched-chain amino acid aminotransferase
MQTLEEGTMTGSYDDRDGKIWLDGQLVDWRAARVHVMTHALHYASSVFEGERAYGGTIFRSRDHSERLHFSAGELDFEIPYSVDEIEAAKASVLAANGLSDAYVRAVAWRGAGEDMGVASARNPVRLAIAAWEWGAYYGDAKFKGAKLDIAKWKRPSPETIPVHAKAAGLYMICTTSKHAAEAKGCSDALFMDYRGYVAECTGANIFFVKDGEVHTPKADVFLNGLTRQTVIDMLHERNIPVHERAIMPEELEGFEQCWLTGTAAEVTPVGQIGDYRFEVGTLAREMVEAYETRVRG